MKKNDELKAGYLAECAKIFPNGDGMVKYFEKGLDFVIQLPNGMYCAFDKPRIETSFCFGYSCIGQGPSYMETMDTYSKLSRSEQYFMDRNLEKINDRIEMLSDESRDVRYCGKYDGRANICELTENSLYWPSDEPKLPVEYRKILLDALNLQKEHFVKRLKTYLKRYGTSKLHTWTYCCDD